MRRLLLSPKWLLGHVLVLAAFMTCLWLGWWQLARFESDSGGAQNAGYALQWPVFGAFVLFFWARVIKAELRPPEPTTARPPTARPPAAAAPEDRERPAPDDADDPELAAYNRYLAQLHAADTRSLQRGE